jgi:bacterioferritin-associated ferredoxin
VAGDEVKLPAAAEAAAHGEVSALVAAAKAEKGKEAPIPAVDEETLSLYPTAAQCGQCHKQIYEEWSSSQHAYSSISPMFHAFEQKFQELTQGTVGTFCVRCHQQVGTQLGENRETPLWARSQISHEGVSCITCHRVKEQYGKVNGERRVEPGKIFDPVYGSGEQSVLKDILANKGTYSVKTRSSASRSSASAATRSRSTWASSSRSYGISIATVQHAKPALAARTATWARFPASPLAMPPHPPP